MSSENAVRICMAENLRILEEGSSAPSKPGAKVRPLLGSYSFEAEKEAGDKPALLSHMPGDGPVCVNSLPSTQSVPTASVTRHTP